MGNKFKTENWLKSGEFNNIEELRDYVVSGFCPDNYIDGFKPTSLNNNGECKIYTMSAEKQLKPCKACWNMAYIMQDVKDSDNEYSLYLRLKEKYQD